MQPQVVLVGHGYDEHADYLEKLLLDRAQVDVVRLSMEDLPNGTFVWEPEDRFEIAGFRIVRGAAALLRRWGKPQVDGYESAYQAFVESESRDALLGALQSLDLRWLSLPTAVARAELKLVQLRTAHSLKIPVPPTVVTNSREVAVEFSRRHGAVVAKAVRYALVASEPVPKMSWTSEQSPESLAELEGSPVILQKRIPGSIHLRVISVEREVFVSVLEAEGTDWRRDLANHERFVAARPSTFPTVRQMALDLAAELNLGFTAQDWIVDRDEGPVFLEANPSGQWLFLEDGHEGEIGRSIVGALERLAANRT